MPGSAFFEAVIAAASIALPSSIDSLSGFCGVSIPAALPLQRGVKAYLETMIDTAIGRAEVASSIGEQMQIHCRGSLCQISTGAVFLEKLLYNCV